MELRNMVLNRMDLDEERLYSDECHNLIYRYKFTQEFMEELYEFSKIHQYDDRKDFKEAWEIWIDENREMIKIEESRLKSIGYCGNVIEKMFKSARYYFRKKSTFKKEAKQRRMYISINKELLKVMDKHISNNVQNADFKPKIAFIQFCKENETILKEEINNILEKGVNDYDLIEEKIKKTYKNRFYLFNKNE